MDTKQILTDLRAERDRLSHAITALEALNSSTLTFSATSGKITVSRAKSGRRISPEGMARIIAATKARWARVRAGKAPAAGHRQISAAGRKAMSEASKRRWAAHRKGTAATTKSRSNVRTMSPVARNRIADAMRKRWAERRKAA